jgi:hypothetical protein
LQYLTVFLLALTIPAIASAQTIHGHPQKAFYASPAEWPTDSSQCHWKRGNDMQPNPPFPDIPVGVSVADPQIAHTHLDCALPRYGEITGSIPVTCIIKLFHTAGVAGGLYSPFEQIRDIIYEDTGTSTPPVMRGDPMGLKQWRVSFIFDPTLIRHTFPPTTTVPPRGWFPVDVAIRTYYDNGDTVTLDAVRTLYSMLNPNVPEIKGSDEGITYATRCSPNTLRRPELNLYGNQMGTVVSEFVTLIPITPIQDPWPANGFFYSYASLEGVSGFQFPDGTFELRRDLDIHNGVPGVTLAADSFQGATRFTSSPVTFDPATLGSGTHKIAAIWQQPDGKGNDSTALFVFDLTVGPGVPPPTTCEDPRATNKGGPLPCVFPASPDVCPNIAGIQLTVPDGLVLVGGECDARP